MKPAADQHLEQLARQLAALTPQQRDRVLRMAFSLVASHRGQDWWEHVERVTVSAADMRKVAASFKRPPAPTPALRRLMGRGK